MIRIGNKTTDLGGPTVTSRCSTAPWCNHCELNGGPFKQMFRSSGNVQQMLTKILKNMSNLTICY